MIKSTKTITVTTYTAEDGMEFDNKLACEKYEVRLQLQKIYLVFDGNSFLGVFSTERKAQDFERSLNQTRHNCINIALVDEHLLT